MRILHELNQLERGGAERVVAGIVKYDKENLHAVYSYKDGPMRQDLEAAGAIVIVEDKEKTPNINQDVIHIHTGGDPSRMAEALKGQFPLIETVHCPVVSAVRDKWVWARVGVTNSVTRLNRKCRTIYNGVDLERLEETSKPRDRAEGVTLRTAFGIPEDAYVVGRLGRIGYDKNVEESLVAAWKFQRWAEDNGTRPVHVLVVGDEAMNAAGYLAKVKVIAASLPIKNIHFVDGTTPVGWAYEAMDVFLYPSEHEAFGLVWAEAAVCGVPVVTWETEVSREILLGCAYLSPMKTIDGLVTGLKLMYTKPLIAEEFALLGNQNMQAYFSAEIMSKNYAELYKNVFETGGIPLADGEMVEA